MKGAKGDDLRNEPNQRNSISCKICGRNSKSCIRPLIPKIDDSNSLRGLNGVCFMKKSRPSMG